LPENQGKMLKNTPIKLVMFDMAGTTVQDNDEVLFCFAAACKQEGLLVEDKRLNALMGVSKLEVFQILWSEVLGKEIQQQIIETKAQHSFLAFCEILEDYYRSQPVIPTEGTLEVFEWLRHRDIKVALNTGFYRLVTDIILNKLGWLAGLDAQYVGGSGSIIDFSIASDEVPKGRPEPYMIQKAMDVFGIQDPKQVVKIGDTPVDLAEGRKAGCAASLAVVNGTHSRSALEVLVHDGLLGSIRELPEWLEKHGLV
jgi:phosphonatase-like hydrolase